MNILLAMIGSVGVTLIVLAFVDLLFPGGKKGEGEIRLQVLPTQKKTKQTMNFFGRLEVMLFQAHANISVTEFIMVSLMVGGLLGVLIYLTTRALIVSIIMLVAGGVLYYLYLLQRREKLSMEYENLQPQVAYMMLAQFNAKGNNLMAVLEYLATGGPELIRDDWKEVWASMSSSETDYSRINKVLSFRNSPSFTKLVEIVLMFRDNVQSMTKVLVDVRKMIAEDVEIARENNSTIYSAKSQLTYVACMPVGLTIVFSLMMPQYADFYASFIGQIVVLISWSLCAGAYFFGATMATKASMTRPYIINLMEERGVVAYTPQSNESENPGSTVYQPQE